MILTKTTEYAVRILTYMASQDKGIYSAKYLHKQLNIPYKYLTKLMTDLSKSGFLASVKGRDGGFSIIKDIKEITISKIIETVEGMESFNACVLGFKDCSCDDPCAMHFVWEENKISLLRTLETTTVFDLKNRKIAKY